MDSADFRDDNNPFANPEAQPARRGRGRWIVVGVLALAAAGALWWYLAVPHSPAEQFARAEQLEAELIRQAPQLSNEERAERLEEVREAYRRVFTKFDPDSPEAPEAHLRLAETHRLAGLADDEAGARQWWGRLTEAYPDSEQARAAWWKIVASLRKEGVAQLRGDRAAGVATLREALATLERFEQAYGPEDGQAARAAIERCRILHDDIAEPPIDAIRALEAFLEAHGDSEFIDEALVRLGRLYEQIAEPATAERYYRQLIEEHPESAFLRQAEVGQARALSQYDPEAGEQAWRELAAKYPDDADLRAQADREADRLARQQQADAQTQQARQAREQAEEYRSSRYGGGGGGGGGAPMDSGFGKPVPPAEMLRDFIEQGLDATHYVLDVRIDPDTHMLSVEGSMELVNGGQDKRELLLMLGPLFEVESMSLDGQAVDVQRPPGKGEVLLLGLSEVWPAGATGVLQFAYSGTVEPLELPAGLDDRLMQQLTGEIPPESAEDAEPIALPPNILQDPRLQVQLNDTGYGLSGACWYPVTIIGDLATGEMTFTLTGERTAWVSGALLERRSEGGESVSRWRMEKPYFGFYFAYGPFRTVTRTLGGVEVSASFLPAQADRMDAYLDAMAEILAFYVERFGPFPFEKMALVQTKLPPILGGVGPASLLLLHSTAIERSDEVLVNLLAHELAHQWWGNLIPINLTDAAYSQWLSEGFATYSDALYTEYTEGAEKFREHVREMGALYLDQSQAVREEALVDTFMGQSPLYRVVVYEKGALVLHALRFVVGDEVFWRVLREYAEQAAFQATTVDTFRRLASEAAGENLDWFFDEWLDRPGVPAFVIDDVQVAGPDAAGQRTVTVAVHQPDGLSRMPLEVLIEGPAGQSRRVRAELGRKESQVEATVDFPVHRVTLDPDAWILRRRVGVDSWTLPAEEPAP